MAFPRFKMSVLPFAQEAKGQAHFCGDFAKTKQPNFHLIPVKLSIWLAVYGPLPEDLVEKMMLEIPKAL